MGKYIVYIETDDDAILRDYPDTLYPKGYSMQDRIEAMLTNYYMDIEVIKEITE